MPRFVLLFHEYPPKSVRPSHWDLMLESAGVLRTWALSANPVIRDLHEMEIAAVKLPDHRLEYLDYQGPISAGRGEVARVAAGQFEILSETEFELVLEISSKTLAGQWKLSSTSPASTDHWLLRRI